MSAYADDKQQNTSVREDSFLWIAAILPLQAAAKHPPCMCSMRVYLLVPAREMMLVLLRLLIMVMLLVLWRPIGIVSILSIRIRLPPAQEKPVSDDMQALHMAVPEKLRSHSFSLRSWSPDLM